MLVITFSCSCFGAKYPVPFFIEDEEVISQLYIEPVEEPFTGLSKQDRLFSDYMTAIAKKDLHQANNFLSPEMRVKDEKTFKWLMSQDLGKLQGVKKCLYSDHYVYIATTSVGQQFLCLRQNDKNPQFIPFNDYPFQVLCGEALTSFLRKKSSPKDLDITKMSMITYGSNDVANLYFSFLESDHQITATLAKDIQQLNQAYEDKDLDILPSLVNKESLGRMMTGMMNGTPDPRFRTCSFESVGIINMDPVYVYLGHRAGDKSLFFRKFIKQGDDFFLVNYLGGGGPLEVFLESVEFKQFALNKYKQAYPSSDKSKK
jgi:hypothetical protein